MGPKGDKMGQVGAKLAGSCGQEAPRSTQEGYLASCWDFLANLEGIFGTSCRKDCKPKRLQKHRFFKVLATLGVSWWGS